MTGASDPRSRQTPGVTGLGTRTGEDPDAETLQRDIEVTREALGETVEALARKADVKGQIRERIEGRKQQLSRLQANAKAQVRTAADQARSQPAQLGGVVAVLLAAFLMVVWWGRRRR